MGWFDGIFGDDDVADANQGNARPSGDPLGGIFAEPAFDAFRSAWKAGAKLFDLFGNDPVTIKEPVGPEAPNRRADVTKVETFLGRTGHLDLAKTEGPTGYYGARVDQGVRRFQKDNALKVDGLINLGGPTLSRIGASLSEIAGDIPDQPWRTPSFNPDADRPRNAREPVEDAPSSTSSPSLFDRVTKWFDSRTSDTADRQDDLVRVVHRNEGRQSPNDQHHSAVRPEYPLRPPQNWPLNLSTCGLSLTRSSKPIGITLTDSAAEACPRPLQIWNISSTEVESRECCRVMKQSSSHPFRRPKQPTSRDLPT